MAALAGANLIYGLGMIESGVTFDFAQLVMDNELARMIKYCVGGIRVDDESLAVEDIAAVGAFGDFLSLDGTLRHMREQSQPALIDRRVREQWAEAGSTSLYERSLAKARQLLETHVVEPPSEAACEEMTKIVAEAERDLGVRAS